MKEKPGSAFLLANEARYKWKHGIPPIEYPRISVTVRIFKPHHLTPEVFCKVNELYELHVRFSVTTWRWTRRTQNSQTGQQNSNRIQAP